MIIYRTTNTINGKIYIGKDEKNRPWYLGSGVYLRKAIAKYGYENFVKTTIDTAASRDELCEKEIYWIDFYNSQTPNVGYNVSEGGDGGDNFTNNPRREKIRTKITLATREAMKNPEIRKKLQGPKSEAIRKNMSDAHKGLPTWNKGGHLSEEHKQNLSRSRIEKGTAKGKNNPMYGRIGELSPHFGKKYSEEHRTRISAANRGRKLSEEHKRKIGEARNKLYSTIKQEKM
jgi:hypothetical protein